MRSRSCTTVAGADSGGVMVRRRATLVGFRLHLTTTTPPVVDQWMLAPAAHHAGTLTPALVEDAHGLWVVGDHAFHQPTALDWLQQHRASALVALPRRTGSRAWPKAVRQQVNHLRRTIERALRVLCPVLQLEPPGSRSLAGLLSRVTTRVLAYTLSFVVWTFLPALKN